jgi:sulfur-oxidizing protein SoxY
MKLFAVLIGLALANAILPTVSSAATAEEERAARWNDIRTDVFGTKPVRPTDTLIKLEAPDRALDAAFVPITLTMPEKDKVAAVYLFIDDNPSPYAAHFTFGPAADPASIGLRVRVDSYTNIHAVVETKDGALYETAHYIKAAGGCSAPVGASAAEASKGMGEMRLRFAEGAAPEGPVDATLMIRHPNFSGMQMDVFTKGFTPARYVKEIEVSAGGQRIFRLDGDISISSDPVIQFRYMPQGGARDIQVSALDSQNGRWQQSFAPQAKP